jgi:hypothetical protein
MMLKFILFEKSEGFILYFDFLKDQIDIFINLINYYVF